MCFTSLVIATKPITQMKPCVLPRQSRHKTHHSDEAMCFTSSLTPQNPSLRRSHVLHLVTHATKPITQMKPCVSPRESKPQNPPTRWNIDSAESASARCTAKKWATASLFLLESKNLVSQLHSSTIALLLLYCWPSILDTRELDNKSMCRTVWCSPKASKQKRQVFKPFMRLVGMGSMILR